MRAIIGKSTIDAMAFTPAVVFRLDNRSGKAR